MSAGERKSTLSCRRADGFGMTLLVTLLALHAFTAGACRTPSPQAGVPIFLIDRIDEIETSFDRSQLLSHRSSEALAGTFTFNEETRVALAPLLPSEMRFSLQVPEDAVLRFAIGVLAPNETTLPAQVAFRLHIESGTGRETVYDEAIRRFQPNSWLDREVPLDRWTGHRVTLLLETAPASLPSGSRTHLNPVIPLWANPIVDGRAPRKARRNLFLISIDCLRADHVGAYGYSRDTTPELDRFAEGATVFQDAVAAAPETLLSHMSMFTGMPPSLHGASRWSGADPTVPYLPEILAQNGFEVSGLVTGAFLSRSFGLQRGFHRYRFIDQPGATATADTAIEMLEHTNRTRQFFFLHFFDAHWPYLPPRELIDRFGPRPKDVTDLMAQLSYQDYQPPDRAAIDQVINLYDAEILRIDGQLGRFLDELKKTGRFEDALIVVVGDHGEAFYEHGWWQHTFTLYQEMTRIPLVVKWPRVGQHATVATPVGHVDLFPTLLHQAGLPTLESWGRDLQPIADSAGTTRPRDVVSEAAWRSDGRFFWKIALRSGAHKYIVSLEGDSANGWPPRQVVREELYDLESDPKETSDLGAGSGIAVGPFRQRARAYMGLVQARYAGRPMEEIELDETLKERLRSLGYVVY